MWLTPFCFFVIGYMGARYYSAPETVAMPSFIGMHATEALILLSEYHLTPHIIAQKEENDVPHGTILQQSPAPGQTIKKRQSIFLVIATKSKPLLMPHYVQIPLNEIQRQSKQENINVHAHHIPHAWPAHTCFAQWPSPGEPLTKETPIVYVSSGDSHTIIWPDFIGQDAQDVITFLNEHQIHPDIVCHYTHATMTSYKGYRVIDQRPLAGSCVQNDKPEQLITQLRIE